MIVFSLIVMKCAEALLFVMLRNPIVFVMLRHEASVLAAVNLQLKNQIPPSVGMTKTPFVMLRNEASMPAFCHAEEPCLPDRQGSCACRCQFSN